MSCVRCPEGYWVCDSEGDSGCGPNMIGWVEVGTVRFEAGENRVWCKPGSNCGAKVQDHSPGPSWKEAGTIPLDSAADGMVYCRGTGAGGSCQVKVVF